MVREPSGVGDENDVDNINEKDETIFEVRGVRVMYREIREVRGVQRLSERVIGSEGVKRNKAGTIGIERQGR